MFIYSAYGLTIHSELPLPELSSCEADEQTDAAVTIRWGAVPHPPNTTGTEQCIWASASAALFFWDDIGTLLVRNGDEIVVDPLPEVAEEVLRLFILGAALGTLLHQRGLLVLHASVVAVNGQAIAFIGESGWGKSTTAAALCVMGYHPVADDVLAMAMDDAGVPIVLPGFPQFKLWSDAIAALGYDPETRPRLRPEIEKRSHRIAEGFSLAPLPLRKIYVLGKGEQLGIAAIGAQAAFLELVRHSYAVRFLGNQGINALHFQQCTQLVKSIPISRLNRRPALGDLPDIVQQVKLDLDPPNLSSHQDSR